MPWSASDAARHDRAANTPKRRRQWAHVANGVLKRTGNEGRAVREANAAVGRSKRKSRRGRRHTR